MADLSALLQSGEGETLEFKERWNAVLETLAAFADNPCADCAINAPRLRQTRQTGVASY